MQMNQDDSQSPRTAYEAWKVAARKLLASRPVVEKGKQESARH